MKTTTWLLLGAGAVALLYKPQTPDSKSLLDIGKITAPPPPAPPPPSETDKMIAGLINRPI